MRVRLLNQSDETLDEFLYEDSNLVENQRNGWNYVGFKSIEQFSSQIILLLNFNNHLEIFQVHHEFVMYGRGLRKIQFIHGGRDRRFCGGNHGSKVARACVKVTVPVPVQDNNLKIEYK